MSIDYHNDEDFVSILRKGIIEEEQGQEGQEGKEGIRNRGR